MNPARTGSPPSEFAFIRVHSRFSTASIGLRLRAATLALLLIILHQSSVADVVTLGASADTTLHEYFPENNLGAQVHFNAGTTQNGPRTRGLMQFDIAGSLPAGATINSVSLILEVVGQPVDGDAPSNFGLHRMLVGWGEGSGSGNPPLLGRAALPGEVTWTHRFAQSPLMWAAPGGMAGVDFVAAFSSDTFVYGVNLSPYVFGSTAMFVSDAQGWLDHPESNFGWMILTQSESEIFSARRFGSREDSFRGPLLEIDFTPVPEPHSMMLWMLGGATILALHRRRGCRCRVQAP